MNVVADMTGRSRDIALACIQQTKQVWRQHNGEPLEQGFQRVFGKPMPDVPLLTVAVPVGGRMVTVHLHSGGIAAVYDPALGGWELRALPKEQEQAPFANMATAMPQHGGLMLNWVAR